MKKSSKSNLLSNSVTYILSNLILKAFNFLLLPLYTTYLTTDQYGITNLTTKFQNVATIIIALCLNAAAVRFYADYKEDREKVKRFFGTLICFVFLAGIIFGCMGILFRRPLTDIIFKGIDFFPTILMSLVALIFITIVSMYQEIMKAMQNGKRVAITSISYFFIQLSLNICFVVYYKLGANGVILSSIISNLSISLYMLVYMIRRNIFAFCIDLIMLKEAIKYSVPLIPHNISISIQVLISNIFINQFSSLASVGLYGLASQFGAIADMIQGSTNSAFLPWFYDKMKLNDQSALKDIKSTANIIAWFFGLVMLGICLFSQEAILLFCNKAYYRAWPVVPLIILMYIFNIPYFFYVNILFYFKKASKYIFLATFPTSILDIILSYFLIRRFDMYGSVIGDIIFQILKVCIVIYISEKYERIGYKIEDFIKIIVLCIVLSTIGIIPSFIFCQYKISLLNFIYKCGIIAVYLVIFFFQKKDWKANIKYLKQIQRSY